MRFRKLRIAWSVVWGLATVLLLALWVRSYWWSDQYHLHGSRLFGCATNRGLLALHWLDVSKRDSVETGYRCYTVDVLNWKEVDTSNRRLYRYYVITSPEGYVLVVPLWFVAAMIAFLTAVPWIPKRFSLRTLLIATTLIALVLGLIAWLR